MDVRQRGLQWQDIQGQRRQGAEMVTRAACLDYARYYAALLTLLNHESFQIVLEHMTQWLLLTPQARQMREGFLHARVPGEQPMQGGEPLAHRVGKEDAYREFLEDVRLARARNLTLTQEADAR